jgi:DNA-binding XRE family transcriptional regulator
LFVFDTGCLSRARQAQGRRALLQIARLGRQHSTIDSAIGRRLAAIRAHRMMSPADLAAAINVTRGTIWHYEHGCAATSLASGGSPRAFGHRLVERGLLATWTNLMATVRGNPVEYDWFYKPARWKTAARIAAEAAPAVQVLP